MGLPFLRVLRVGFALGWTDIRESYAKTSLGSLWIAVGVGTVVLAIGLVFSNVFNVPLETYLPFISSGFVSWSLMSGIFVGGATAYTSAGSLLSQVRLPIEVHVVRSTARSTIMFGHVAPVILAVSAFFQGLSLTMLLLALLLPPVIFTLHNISLALALITSRFRDFGQLVQNALNFVIYLTPVFWIPEMLSGPTINALLSISPFFHALQLIRLPLMGQAPSTQNVIALLTFFALGLLIRKLVLRRSQKTVVRWVS